MQRRGARVLNRLASDTSAIIVIDVQNDFCDPAGLMARQGANIESVDPAVTRLLEFLTVARRDDVPIFFIQNSHSSATDTPEWLGRHLGDPQVQTCQVGTWGAEFYRIAPEGDDIVIAKHRYNAFTGTTLEDRLTSLGRNSLLFCGVSTSVCVENSLRDAVCRDFLATLVEDCCADYSADAHQHAVAVMEQSYGAVAKSSAIQQAWAAEGEPAAG